MTKILRALPFVFLFTFSVSFFASTKPAEAKEWTWRLYRLKFWLPNSMKVTQNDRHSFIAKTRGLVLKIAPWKSSVTTSKNAALYGYRSYNIVKRKRILYSKRLGKRGAWTYAIVGEGWVQGQRVRFGVIGLASRRSNNNFYIRMWWPKWRNAWMKTRVNTIANNIRVY